MANNIAFQPMGKTFKLTANANVQTIQVTADSPVTQDDDCYTYDLQHLCIHKAPLLI